MHLLMRFIGQDRRLVRHSSSSTTPPTTQSPPPPSSPTPVASSPSPTSILLHQNRVSDRRIMGSNTRFGFVTFSSHRGVALAIARFNGFWCLDRRLQVSKARSSFKKVTRRCDSCPTWRRVEPMVPGPVWKRIEPADNQVGVRRERWAQRCANSSMRDEEEPTLQGNLEEAKVIKTEWEPNLIRSVWIYVEGVPLHAWNEITFSSIGGLWGDVVLVDERTSNRGDIEETK
ncbi:hypothetical protein U1Q18_027638 [Sarracenia purpurea var. burkii]